MTSQKKKKNALLEYLKQAAISGILNPAVARSRKTAAEQLLVYVTPEERLNLKLVDVDELCSRIHKLEDSSIRVEALNLYNSRLKSALSDYFLWLENPEGFISNSSSVISSNKLKKERITAEEKALEDISLKAKSLQEDIIPVRLRQNLTVYIKDLPLDLTPKEAQKIIKIINAYANDSGDDE